MVKNLPAVQETWVQSVGFEDPLAKGRLPTPVFLPGESHGQRILVGCSPWGHKELDMTEHARTIKCLLSSRYLVCLDINPDIHVSTILLLCSFSMKVY